MDDLIKENILSNVCVIKTNMMQYLSSFWRFADRASQYIYSFVDRASQYIYSFADPASQYIYSFADHASQYIYLSN